MSVPGVTQSISLDRSIPDQTTPQFTYEYVDEGFYYTVARLDRGREFIALPGLTATQVQELFENGKVFPPENLDGGESFGFTHGWHIDRYKVGIVAEDGVLCCTVFDETGSIIHDEEIPQTDSDDKPLSAGKIFCRASLLTPLFYPDGKLSFFCFSRLDPKITVDESRRAVTLVNSKAPSPKWPFGHAVLLIEKVKNGQYKTMIAHFTVNGSYCKALVGTSPGKVKYEEVDHPYYHSKTETWSLLACQKFM